MTSTKRTKGDSRADRGVSPVIGVIMMVGITVIMAAVIGTYVLDIGQVAGRSAPSASLATSIDTQNDIIEIRHQGGDGLSADSTRVIVTNESSGDTAAWSHHNESVVFSVGMTAQIDLPAGTIDWDGSSDADYGTEQYEPGYSSLVQDTKYTVQLIDTDSQRVIYETTMTA